MSEQNPLTIGKWTYCIDGQPPVAGWYEVATFSMTPAGFVEKGRWDGRRWESPPRIYAWRRESTPAPEIRKRDIKFYFPDTPDSALEGLAP